MSKIFVRDSRVDEGFCKGLGERLRTSYENVGNDAEQKAIPPSTKTSISANRGALIVALMTLAGITIAVLIQSTFFSPSNHPNTSTEPITELAQASYSPIPTATPPLTDEALALERALAGVETNAEWEALYPDGYMQEFNTVPMLLVPAACFQMGNDPNAYDSFNPVPDAGLQCVDAFWIDQYEVSQAQFRDLGGTKANANRFDGDNRPVENITWYEARDFCHKRGAELPSEAQWEYVARGVDELFYPWGNEFIADNVLYTHNTNNQTADVGSRPNGASWVGAFDMSGNVWEWTNSLFLPYPYDAALAENADSTNPRSLRGGSWFHVDDYMRSANRHRHLPDIFLNWIGFRCARSL